MCEARDPAQSSDVALVICSLPDWRVEHASENLADLLELSAASAVGRSAAELCGQHAPPDVALLDVNLGDETSLQVARRLKELGRPFVFSTGYGEQQAVTDEFPDAPQLSKPFPARMLLAALDEAFRRR